MLQHVTLTHEMRKVSSVPAMTVYRADCAENRQHCFGWESACPGANPEQATEQS